MDKVTQDLATKLSGGFSTPNVKYRENAAKVYKKAIAEGDTQVELRESMKHTSQRLFGQACDITNPAEFPVTEDSFSWKAVKKACMKEADSASTFSQVLRAGIQTIVNSAYLETLETTNEDWVKTIPSKMDTELYAPLHGISFPREVGRQEKYPEARAAGLDIKLPNRKYGQLYAVEKELIMDDQTGQFQSQVRLLGEYMRYLIEALCYGKLASVANMQYAEFEIPISETQPSDEAVYPWAPASTPFVGGGYNRPATYGALQQGTLQTAKTTLMNQKNKLGLKMAVNGKRLLIGPTLSFDAAVILNSSYFPSVLSGSAGAVGQSFAINPVKGLADISVTRFMFKNDGTCNGDSTAWYLVDDSKPWFVMQLREAVAVEQEAPNSGAAFERDIYRWKVSMRGNADFIDPRFAFQGNNGSV